jgi:hypothetical protein
MSDDFMYSEQANGSYKRVVNLDGVRTTICENRFEILVSPNSEVWEQVSVQLLKDWIKWRKDQAELREPRDLPE